MFGLKKKQKLNPREYDKYLTDGIADAKYDYEKAKLSEEALFESDLDPRYIVAQTALQKQKYFFLLRAARQRKVVASWHQAFVHPEN
ncbi:hypothetical protein JOC36_000328 [Weissella uvarum]|uniref:YaaL family protein n=1 Tax=Weissella uvarum TaxID=1479233 RepID=UPI001962129F|nr:YaaL family protein [Weissella uvarum]MBM7616795.1 hypothetical protein [Weissella uvarum]MCM0594751.1 YaaL family protein [Weissella uvarum]